MKDILNSLLAHKYLTKQQAKSILLEIGRGKYNSYQIVAFLTIFGMRGIQPQELRGFKEAMLELCLQVDLSQYDGVDIVGTGGDEKNSFNISTASSFVVAASGVNVTKHGNYGVSSVCGSSSLLEYLGVKFSNQKDDLKRMLDRCGFCMLHAPLFHPAMKFVAPLRKALQIKTFFNMLGPMINPSFPKKQFLGVYSLAVARLYHYVYQDSDIDYTIVHSLDGYDEVALTSDVKVYSQKGETTLSPRHFGFSRLTNESLRGGVSIKENAKIFQAILKNEASHQQKNVVLANAGLVLSMVKNISILEGVALAKETLISGKALQALKNLLEQ